MQKLLLLLLDLHLILLFDILNLPGFVLGLLALLVPLVLSLSFEFNSLLLSQLLFLLEALPLAMEDLLLPHARFFDLLLLLDPLLLVFLVLQHLLLFKILSSFAVSSFHFLFPPLDFLLLLLQLHGGLLLELQLLLLFDDLIPLGLIHPLLLLLPVLLLHHFFLHPSFILLHFDHVLLSLSCLSPALFIHLLFHFLFFVLLLQLHLPLHFSFSLLHFFHPVSFSNFLLASLVLHHGFDFLLLLQFNLLELLPLFLDHGALLVSSIWA